MYVKNNSFDEGTVFSNISQDAYNKLKEKEILLVGLADYIINTCHLLIDAGIRKLHLMDWDANINEQEEDKKLDKLRTSLKEANPDIDLKTYKSERPGEKLTNLLTEVDLIIDCTNHFPYSILIDQMAKKSGIPWIYGASAGAVCIYKFVNSHQGESISGWLSGSGIPASFGTCSNGLLTTINGIIASLQSTSAIKYLTEAEGKIDQQLYYIDIWNNKFDKININN